MSSFAKARQQLVYGAEDRAHLARSKAIEKYLSRKATASIATADAYRSCLAAFAQFVRKSHKQEVDDLIEELKQGKANPYDRLAEFAAFLKTNRTGDFELRANTLTYQVKCAKRLMRFSGVPGINNEDFHEQVSLPRREIVTKEGASKKDVIVVLNAAGVRLRTFLLFEAVFGPRPLEACAVRNRDIDLKADLAPVMFRAQFSKMRVARKRYMTRELVKQCRNWLAVKYAPHRTTMTNEDGTATQVYVTPEPKPDKLFFAPWHPDGNTPKPQSVYDELRNEFADLVDRCGLGAWEDGDRRREITLYSVGRRFTKTTISDLGFGDFAEYWIGHATSTYYRKPEAEVIAMWRRIEPYLTFTDPEQLSAQGADLQAKIEEMQKHHEQQISAIREQMQQEITALRAALMAKEILHQHLYPSPIQKAALSG